MNEVTRSRAVAALAVCLLSTSMAGRALAEEAPPQGSSTPPVLGGSVGYFGEHGEVAISGDMKFNILHQSQTGTSYTSYEVQPALDYFVSTNVSVGGLLGIRKDPLGGSASRTTFAVGGRVGYNVFLSSAVSLWVRGGLNYGHFTDHVVGSPDDTGSYVSLSVYAPVLWHPVPHFFLGAGPFLEQDLYESNSGPKATDFGISSTVGGYFGGL
jgi:hypothetical protein